MAKTNGNGTPHTVRELIDRYMVHAAERYQKRDKDGILRPTRETQALHYAAKALIAVAGDKAPDELAAEDLIEAQRWMIEQGNNRRTINRRVQLIRRIVKWAVRPPQRFIPAAVHAEFQVVEPLRPNRSKAPEPKRVQPVPWEHIEQTLKHADARIAAIIKVQWATGMRPGEVTGMRFSELHADDNDPSALTYIPKVHKTDAYVDRTIPIPPSGLEALKEWVALRWTTGDEIFGIQRNSYGNAVRQITRKHSIPHWHPNQIRHSLAVRLRSAYGAQGIEAAQALLGHTSSEMTRHYASQMTNAVDMLRQLDRGGAQ